MKVPKSAEEYVAQMLDKYKTIPRTEIVRVSLLDAWEMGQIQGLRRAWEIIRRKGGEQ
jgi:hypothetical protein